MKRSYYSKTHSLVNLSSSILKYYDVTPFHNSIPEIDEILNASKKKSICVILFDALGKDVKHKCLSKKDSLIRHEVLDITSVFPPTTVAATNAFLSGKYPIETGWLGWRQHFNDLDITIDMFSNVVSYINKKLDYKLSYEKCGYKNIISLINKGNKYKASDVFPDNIDKNGAKTLNHFFSLINDKVKSNNFIYAYWSQPDHVLHDYGTSSIIVKTMVKEINRKIARLAKSNPDTMFLIIADHGIMDSTYYDLYEHKDLSDLIKFKPSIDARSLMISLKDGNVNIFKELFFKYYSQEDFIIYNKNEIIENEIFGIGEKHKEFDNFLGDLMIISISNKTFIIPDDNGEYNNFSADHAGGTSTESLISISIYNK